MTLVRSMEAKPSPGSSKMISRWEWSEEAQPKLSWVEGGGSMSWEPDSSIDFCNPDIDTLTIYLFFPTKFNPSIPTTIFPLTTSSTLPPSPVLACAYLIAAWILGNNSASSLLNSKLHSYYQF